MPRLFTGFEIPPEVVDRLAALRGGLPGARWTDPANYHMTLRFVGDIDRHTARELEDSLMDVRTGPLALTLTGLDAFGGARPHALIASVAPSRDLADLQGEHERAARRAGLPPEKRKFTPHITLAHLRATSVLDLADYLSIRGGFPPISFQPERFVLYSARDQVGGGPYLVEAAYPMGMTACAGWGH